MQTPDRPDFYLKHDFEKQYSDYGVPYAAEDCVIDPQSDNITIYGHHMKSGKMFGALEDYKSETPPRIASLTHRATISPFTATT